MPSHKKAEEKRGDYAERHRVLPGGFEAGGSPTEQERGKRNEGRLPGGPKGQLKSFFFFLFRTSGNTYLSCSSWVALAKSSSFWNVTKAHPRKQKKVNERGRKEEKKNEK